MCRRIVRMSIEVLKPCSDPNFSLKRHLVESTGVQKKVHLDSDF